MKTKFVAMVAMIVLIGAALLSPGIVAASEGEDVTDAYGDILQLHDRDRDQDQTGPAMDHRIGTVINIKMEPATACRLSRC